MERRTLPSGQTPVLYFPPGGSKQLRSWKQARSRCWFCWTLRVFDNQDGVLTQTAAFLGCMS